MPMAMEVSPTWQWRLSTVVGMAGCHRHGGPPWMPWFYSFLEGKKIYLPFFKYIYMCVCVRARAFYYYLRGIMVF
jgi:hypothetical protein